MQTFGRKKPCPIPWTRYLVSCGIGGQKRSAYADRMLFLRCVFVAVSLMQWHMHSAWKPFAPSTKIRQMGQTQCKGKSQRKSGKKRFLRQEAKATTSLCFHTKPSVQNKAATCGEAALFVRKFTAYQSYAHIHTGIRGWNNLYVYWMKKTDVPWVNAFHTRVQT